MCRGEAARFTAERQSSASAGFPAPAGFDLGLRRRTGRGGGKSYPARREVREDERARELKGRRRGTGEGGLGLQTADVVNHV